MNSRLDLNLPPVPTFDVKEGYAVHDVNNDAIGHVKTFQFSDNNPATPEIEANSPSIAADQQVSLVIAIADALADTDNIPQEVRSNLLQKGYIRINPGLLQADLFATMDQVARVADSVVYLKVAKNGLPSF